MKGAWGSGGGLGASLEEEGTGRWGCSEQPSSAGGSTDNRLGSDSDPMTSAPSIKMLQGKSWGWQRKIHFPPCGGAASPPKRQSRVLTGGGLSPPLSKTPDSAEKEAAGEAAVWMNGTVGSPSVASGCAGLCERGPRARVASPLGRALAQTILKGRPRPATDPGSQPALPAQGSQQPGPTRPRPPHR